MNQTTPKTIIDCVDSLDKLNSRMAFILDVLSKIEDEDPTYCTLESIWVEMLSIHKALGIIHDAEAIAEKKPNPFQPFGMGVRIGAIGNDGVELCARLSDLCRLHDVDYALALSLEYPNGSLAMLQIKRDEIGTAIHLTASAYRVFMAWVES